MYCVPKTLKKIKKLYQFISNNYAVFSPVQEPKYDSMQYAGQTKCGMLMHVGEKHGKLISQYCLHDKDNVFDDN